MNMPFPPSAKSVGDAHVLKDFIVGKAHKSPKKVFKIVMRSIKHQLEIAKEEELRDIEKELEDELRDGDNQAKDLYGFTVRKTNKLAARVMKEVCNELFIPIFSAEFDPDFAENKFDAFVDNTADYIDSNLIDWSNSLAFGILSQASMSGMNFGGGDLLSIQSLIAITALAQSLATTEDAISTVLLNPHSDLHKQLAFMTLPNLAKYAAMALTAPTGNTLLMMISKYAAKWGTEVAIYAFFALPTWNPKTAVEMGANVLGQGFKKMEETFGSLDKYTPETILGTSITDKLGNISELLSTFGAKVQPDDVF